MFSNCILGTIMCLCLLHNLILSKLGKLNVQQLSPLEREVSVSGKSVLVEGATVLVNPSCLSTWTQADFLARYPLHYTLARSMVGKYVNGVSLNNGNGFTLNLDNLQDANQLYNYLVCPESMLMGVHS